VVGINFAASDTNDVVMLYQGSDAVSIINPATGSVLFRLTANLNNPVAVDVGNFGGGTGDDIAVLNTGTPGNSTVKIFTYNPNTSTYNTGIAPFSLGVTA